VPEAREVADVPGYTTSHPETTEVRFDEKTDRVIDLTPVGE